MDKRILIAPLDWGLGHATRCVPIIRHLLNMGQQPIVAASGRSLLLLRSEFPEVESVEFEGYDISYPEGSGMAWKMFRSTPHILNRIREEHHELQSLIPKLKLDAVISDNRFGLHTRKIPSVYMTHQVMIKAPMLVEPILYRMHADYMRKFRQVWVPDYAVDGLSGDLAHKFPLPKNGQYIGPLSRFHAEQKEETTDVLVVISGPEPQRTRFELQVLKQLQDFDGKAVAVLGTPDRERDETIGNVRIVSHLSANELAQEMAAAKLVVSRSGYSTIMDLAALGKQAVFVPTPGQTEQEYLAQKYHREGKHMMMNQRSFNLAKAWEQRDKFSGFKPRLSDDYKAAVDALVTSLS
ncbi:MAG: glycosyltransferase [Flavobacteriales bacterium]|nr:glycosyltransferase [Flavobacteriales bacterium]